MTTTGQLTDRETTRRVQAGRGGSRADAGPSGPLVRFPRGLPGFPAARAFHLDPLEGCDGRFLVLRSAEDPDLRLIVMPAAGAQAIDPDHLRDACASLDWQPDEVALFYVVTLSAGPTGLDAFVNLRAPVLLHEKQLVAVQVVLADPSYPFRQPLERRP